MKNIFWFLVLIYVLVACKKHSVNDLPISNTPVFKSEGTFDNSHFSVIAGDEGGELITFSKIKNGVKVYSGILKNEDIEIEIGINEYEVNHVSKTKFNEITPNFVTIPNTSIVRFNKINFPNSNEINFIKWYSNNSLIGTDIAEITLPGNYEVRADVTFNDGTFSSLTNDVIVGYELSSDFYISHFFDSDGKLICNSNVTSGEILNIKWNIDGNFYSEDEDIEVLLNGVSKTVTCEILFKDGNKRKKSIFINATDRDNFINDFSFFEQNPLSVVKWDTGLILIVRKNGVEYRSDFSGNQSQIYQVNNLVYYSKNSNGKDVYKFDLKISTNLKSTISNTIIPFDFSSVFGVEFSN